MLLFFVTQYNSSLTSFVPNFRILSQVITVKSLTEKMSILMYYTRVKEGKNEKLKKKANEDEHLNFHLHNTLCLSESVHKI